MGFPQRSGFFIVSCCVLSLHVLLVSAQTCYYPDGSPSQENDVPCTSSHGGACCPSGWECLSNGLCRLSSNNYLGRYTCTDKTWQSPGCPNICTHSNTAVGNEAVLQCSSGNYCCDANRPDISNPPSPGCCSPDSSLSQVQFSLPIGNVVSAGAPTIQVTSLITTFILPPISTSVQGGGFISTFSYQSPPGRSSSLSSQGPPGRSSGSSSSIQTQTSSSLISFGSTSATQPSTFTTSMTPSTSSALSATPAPVNQTGPTSNKAAIIGPAVGVPLALIVIAGIATFFWRRRDKPQAYYPAETEPGIYQGQKLNMSPQSMWTTDGLEYKPGIQRG